MTPNELNELLERLRAGEDTLTELKSTAHESDVKRALVALANTVGSGREGVLFLGAKPNGTPVGVSNADSLGRKVATWAGECYPTIAVDCTTMKVGDLDVVAVTVQASAQRPHFAAPAYVRNGPKTEKASPSMYEELIASRNTSAGAILRHKGEVVTVATTVRLPYGHETSTSTAEFRIDGCTAHSVQLHHLGSGTNISVPLTRVELSADPVHLRELMLHVSEVT